MCFIIENSKWLNNVFLSNLMKRNDLLIEINVFRIQFNDKLIWMLSQAFPPSVFPYKSPQQILQKTSQTSPKNDQNIVYKMSP